MEAVQRRAIFRIDAHEMVGTRLRVDGYLSRTGIQIYGDGMGGERREYRPPEEVFSEDSLESLRGMYVTIRHPRRFVDGKNWKRVTVGFVDGDVRKAEDGRHTMASIWIVDEKTIQKVLDGDLVELSVGYTAELDMAPGVADGETYDAIQRTIRGNHLALLPEGHARGGRTVALRLDAAGHAIFDDVERDTEDDGDQIRPEDKMGMQVTIHADGYDHVGEFADDKVAKAIEKDRAAEAAKLDAAETAKAEAVKAQAEAEARADTAESRVKELETQLADATDPAKIAEAAEARKAFDADLIAVGGSGFKRDSVQAPEGETVTDLVLQRAALESRGINLEGKSDAYVEARFEAEKDIGPREDAVDSARRAARCHDNGGPGGSAKNDSRGAGFSIDRSVQEFGG